MIGKIHTIIHLKLQYSIHVQIFNSIKLHLMDQEVNLELVVV